MISTHCIQIPQKIPYQESTYWEKVSYTRWGSYITEIEKRAILRANNLSGLPSRALEIGAEGGRWSKLLTDLGWKMLCIDIKEEVLRLCHKRIPSADCILVSDKQDTIPIGSKSLNLLLCIEVNPVIQADWFIDEAYRVLQNEGLLLGVFVNLLSFRGLYCHLRAFIKGYYDYYKKIYFRWRKTLLKHGFLMLYEEGFCWFPFCRDSNSGVVPFFTELEKK